MTRLIFWIIMVLLPAVCLLYPSEPMLAVVYVIGWACTSIGIMAVVAYMLDIYHSDEDEEAFYRIFRRHRAGHNWWNFLRNVCATALYFMLGLEVLALVLVVVMLILEALRYWMDAIAVK